MYCHDEGVVCYINNVPFILDKRKSKSYTINMRQNSLDAKDSFSMNLKKIREDRGLSQSDLAEMIDVRRQAIWGLENGNWPAHQTVVKLAKALKCEETDLFRDPDEFKRITESLDKAKKLLNKL